MNNTHLNKWLWACGFFKTPVLAKKAIEKNILLNTKIVSSNHIVQLGDKLIIMNHKENLAQMLQVEGLSYRRCSQMQAMSLYKVLGNVSYEKALAIWQRESLASGALQ